MKNDNMFIRRRGLYCRRLVSLLVIAAMFGGALAWRRGAPDSSAALLLGELALFLLAGWVLFVSYRWFKRNGIRIAAFLLLFLWGAWIYSAMEKPFQYKGGEFLDAANNSLSVFFPSRGDYDEIKKFQETGELTLLQYHLFHFLIYLYFSAIVFSFFGRRMINWGRRRLVSWRNLSVFWEFSPQGFLLAKDILHHSHQEENLFLLPRETQGDRELCDRLDAENFLYDFVDLENADHVFGKAGRHLFFSENPHWNVKMAHKLADYLQKRRTRIRKRWGRIRYIDRYYISPCVFGKGQTIKKLINHFYRREKASVYIRIDKRTDDSFLQGWADQAKQSVNIHIFSEIALTARDFVRRHPMLDCPGISVDTEHAAVSGEFRVLLLGFGYQGEELLKNVICDAQFKGTSFQADIIDRDANVFESYACQCPDAVREYHLVFHPLEVDGGEFHRWFSAHAGTYNRILVCLGNDEINLKTTETLLKIFKDQALAIPDKLIFTQIGCRETFEYCRSAICHFVLFGNPADIYCKEVLLSEATDLIAKTLNKKWDTRYKEREASWRNTSFFNQESSRSSAMGQRNLLRLIGYGIGEQEDEAAPAPEVSAKIEKNLAVLAENEHLRWNAFHFVRGIHSWDMVNPPLASMASKKANQIAQYNRHAALVSFERLPDINYAVARATDTENTGNLSRDDFNAVRDIQTLSGRLSRTSLQGYDILFVRAIPETLAEAGLPVIRLRKP